MRPKPSAPRRAHRPRRFRPGLALRRRPQLWWALTLTAALSVGWLVSTTVARADDARRAWGRTVTVLVADHDVAAGQALEAGDVRSEARPARLVPSGALAELPAGAVARTDLLDGEVVLEGRLAPAGLKGVAATLPGGSRAIAIPIEPGLAPPLAAGDHVDVIVAVSPEAAGDGPPAFTVATDVPVVDVSEPAVTIAVDPGDAPRIASALSLGSVTLVLVGA